MKKAREEALEEGIEQGKAEEKIENVLHFHKLGFDVDNIAKLGRLPVEQVKEILKQHGLKPNASNSNGNGSNGQH